METGWERTLPFVHVDRNTIEKLFYGVLIKNQIQKISLINKGCRTTNYFIESIYNKKYILKIFYEKDESYRKELELFKLLSGKIAIPYIYKFDKSELLNQREYIIYKYIEGETLGSYIQKGNIIDSNFMKQTADMLAVLHNNKYNKVGFLDEKLRVKDQLPPLYEWYDMFMGKNAAKKLGNNLRERILRAVKNNKKEIMDLDNTVSLVHGDFQGTNILIDRHNNLSGILDWEFCMAGHPIADIGQLFRYDQYFNNELINVFKEQYNKNSKYKLKSNWYALAKLRDMVNLIQLLDKNDSMPNKDRDILNIIARNLIDIDSM